MTPLFVFCADLHLEDGAWSTRPGIYGDAYYSFEQIVDYCVLHNLPLILGGDVLEKKSNSARPIAKLCAGLTRMQFAGVPVFYIQGNHEYDRHAPWLSVHPWPQHIHNTYASILGVTVFGLDWLPRGDIQTALANVPTDVDILVTHQVWRDFMGTVGRIECDLTDVHHVQTVLAGDFHVTKIAESVNAQGRPVKMLSPGSIAMQDISEAPIKHFFVIGRESTGFVFVQKTLNTRKFLHYSAGTQDELDALCGGVLANDVAAAIETARAHSVPDDLLKPLVRIKFNKQLPDAYLRLITAVGETAHVFCDALAEKVKTDTSAFTRSRPTNTLLSALEDLLGATSDAYRLAAKLVNSADPAKELEDQFKQHVEEPAGELTNAIAAPECEELGTPSRVNV